MGKWLVVLGLTIQVCHAAILHVPADFTSIQRAIGSSADGDTVHVAPGTYTELLIVPDRNLTLVSDDFFTGDSSAIDYTILDGQWLGTVMTVRARGPHVFRMEGMTLQRGMGSMEWPGRGGAVLLEDSVNVTLRHIVFRENRSPGEGALMLNLFTQPLGRLVLEDLRAHLYRDPRDRDVDNAMFYLLHAQSLVASKWRILGCDLPTNVVFIGADSVSISDVVATSQRSLNTCFEWGARSWLEADSVFISDYHSQDQGVLSLACENGIGSRMRVSHVSLDHCTSEMRYPNSYQGQMGDFWADTLWVDHLSLTNCYGASNVLLGLYGTTYGTVRNLLVEDNECGSPSLGDPSTCEFDCSGNIVSSWRCSFEDVLMQRNVSHIYPMTGNGQPLTIGSGSGLLLRATAGLLDGPDNLFYRRMILQDNLVHDHDDYSNPQIRREANRGRVFYLYIDNTQFRKRVRIEDTVLRRNRQINSEPESFSDDPDLDGSCVGSTLEVNAGTLGLPHRPKLWLRNLLVEDNDDGGILLFCPAHIDAQNVVVRNTSRMGFYNLADTLTLKNILVEGVESWEAHYTYPYSEFHPSEQAAFGIKGGPASSLHNISLLNNETEFLFWTYDNSHPQLTLQNSLVAGNVCRYFVHPWWDSTAFQPPLFSYCLIPSWYPGDHNLYGQNPMFDEELGPPYLSVGSPCVDAGNPAMEWNDPEDLARPGFPLWPSLGILRNDMGYTGGPQAAAIDTGWVAVQRPKPQPGRPASFTLGAPYPNPFNPIALIPYTLDRPRHVRLSVHNLLGQEVAVLMDDVVPAGTHTAQFGTRHLASGTYLVTLESGARSESRTITLLR